MSTGSDSDQSGPATMECAVCETDVPAGKFCGLCGSHLTPRRGNGPSWLRIRAYGAAPGEHLLLPSLASSLFPHLPHRSRMPFRVVLVLVLVALVAFAMLRMPPALITVAALGLPLLFLLYMRETDAHRDLPTRTLLLTAALGIALGVGWVLLTGAMVARSYGVPLGAGIAGTRLLREGLGVPVGGLIVMLVPAVVVRLLRPSTRESLDGFMIGALGALTFTAAATLTRLAPQFGTGMISRNRPVSSLIVEAGIRGLAVPLTAVAVGGLIGAALWFSRPPSKAHQHPGYVRAVLAGFAAAVVAVYTALGLVDVARVPQALQLTIHLAVAVVALLLLRIGLHLALLHEAHDEIHSDEPLLCPHCQHVVPDMAFCPACGVATRAASRSSRTERRRTRPTSADPDEPADATHPGYSVTAGTYTAPPVRRTSRARLLRTWGVAIVVVTAACVGLSVVIHKPPARYACPPDCGRPPTGEPVAINPRFTAPGGEFSVSYPAPGTAYRITTNANGVRADFLGGDGGTMQLMSEPARGRTPEEIAKGLVDETFPDTRTAYQIPNAMVGYQPGYGLVADCWPQGANSNYMRMRVMVMVAVKDDLALIAAAVGPFRQFGPDFGLGKPSGANLQLALDLGKYVNSFSWRGDPPR
ncbi:MAG: zinc ribbon domain-containing protein [Mycobacterium sp.]